MFYLTITNLERILYRMCLICTRKNKFRFLKYTLITLLCMTVTKTYSTDVNAEIMLEKCQKTSISCTSNPHQSPKFLTNNCASKMVEQGKTA